MTENITTDGSIVPQMSTKHFRSTVFIFLNELWQWQRL